MIMVRIHTMIPPDSYNLDNFTNHYNKFRVYGVMPAWINPKTNDLEPLFKFAIQKRELRICPAWQIGENDRDVSAINEDTNPLIPNDVKDPPVVSALQRFNRRGKS